MIHFLFSCFLAVDYLGVDLGSQFYKFALSTNNGQVEIYTNPISNSVINPSAAALKFSSPHSPPYSAEDFADVELRITRAAAKLIKQNSSVGYEFLPSMIGRNHSIFNRSAAVTPEELFPIFIHRATRSLPEFKKVAISLPSMYSRKQFQFIAEAFEMVQMSVGAIVDDMTAVFLLYSSIRLGRFIKEPKHVLFVDVGASVTSAYSGIYTYNKTPSEYALINQTSYGFTEKVSGLEFAKELSKATNVSIHKAMKTLIRTGGEGREKIMDGKMEELTKFLEGIIESASKNSDGKPIDEVQIIGGASTFKFVANTIRTATNHTIRRDFNANDAVAMGAVAAAMILNDASAFLPVSFMKKPTVTINVSFGNVTKEYCKRGENCTSILEFENSPSCRDIIFKADKNDLLSGVSNIIARYHINETLPANSTIRIYVQEPDAAIHEAQYCINESCAPLYGIHEVEENEVINDNINENQNNTINDVNGEVNNDANGDVKVKNSTVNVGNVAKNNSLAGAYSFMTNFMLSISKKLMIVRIEDLLDKLSAHITKLSNKKIEATYPVTDEMKRSVGLYQVLRNGGGLTVMNITETNEALNILSDVAKKLHLNVD